MIKRLLLSSIFLLIPFQVSAGPTIKFLELLKINQFHEVTLKCFQNGEKIIDGNLYSDSGIRLYKNKESTKPFALLLSSDTTCTISER